MSSRAPESWRAPRAAIPACLALAVILTAAGGCARDVTFGQAGEPGGGRPPGTLRLTIDTDAAHAAAARLYAADFEAIGIRVDIEVLPREEVARRAVAGESDASLVGWSGAGPAPLGLLAAKLTPGGRENLSGYSPAEFDRLLSALVNRPLAEDRAAAAKAAQVMLYEEAPWVFGVEHALFDAAASSLTGWKSGPAGAVDLRGAAFQGEGGRLTVGLGLAERPVIDPFELPDPQAGVIYRCLFDALAVGGADGGPEPELAESWEYSTSARRLVVQLRSGVVFHNGDLLRAADVVFTYERALAGRLPGGIAVRVEATGPLSVAFAFSAPFGAFLDLFGGQPIVPADYYASVGPKGFSQAPVGTGPFRIDPEKGRQFLLLRWERHWGGNGAATGLAGGTLQEVAFAFTPDPARRLAMLKNGQIALAPALLPGPAASFRGQAGVVLTAEPGFNLLFLELATAHPPFDDARVRLALNLAVNHSALAAALGPEAVAVPTGFLPEAPGFSPETGSFAYDPDRARRLLGEAGYLTTSPGGP